MPSFTVGPVMSTDDALRIGAEQDPYFRTPEFSSMMLENERLIKCPTAHCGRRKPHGIFSRLAYPIVPCRDLPRFSPGLAARRRSLV